MPLDRAQRPDPIMTFSIYRIEQEAKNHLTSQETINQETIDIAFESVRLNLPVGISRDRRLFSTPKRIIWLLDFSIEAFSRLQIVS